MTDLNYLKAVELANSLRPSVKRRSPTVTRVYNELLEEHWETKRFLDSGHAVEVTMNWRNHLKSKFGGLKITDLSAPAIRQWHRKYVKTPYAGNRSKAALSKICSFAEEKGYLAPGSNPCRSVPNFTEKPRKRYASEEEIRLIGAILAREKEKYPQETRFLYALILTGSRPRAIERLTWEIIERGASSAGFYVVHFEGKTGVEELAIPSWLIKSIPFKIDPVFGTFPRSFWERVREEAGCPDLRARDFRRTFGTFGLSLGLTRGAIGELLNHKSEQTTKGYSTLVPKAKISAARTISDELMKLL